MTREGLIDRKRKAGATGVALLSPTGEMVALPAPSRHSHLFAIAAFMGIDAEDWQQGFTHTEGEFMSRQTAAWRLGHEDGREAFSEDFW